MSYDLYISTGSYNAAKVQSEIFVPNLFMLPQRIISRLRLDCHRSPISLDCRRFYRMTYQYQSEQNVV
jgi:hypothetical protein